MNTPLSERFSGWMRALWPTRFTGRRYRVTPRANPARFRRELLRSIRDELRATGVVSHRAARSTRL